MTPRLFVVVGLTVGLLGSACAPVAASPSAYSAAEIRGWVIDAETKQPLEGVHVVAQWILETGMFFHSRLSTRFHILETVTDAKGEYYFPAWGPKPRPTFASLAAGPDPRILFFKPGYRTLERSNAIDDTDAPLRTSYWHRKTVDLRPFRGSSEQWADHLSSVQISLGWGGLTDSFPRRGNDNWKHCPRVVLAILAERRQLPDRLRWMVSDAESWDFNEEQLRRLVERGGQPK